MSAIPEEIGLQLLGTSFTGTRLEVPGSPSQPVEVPTPQDPIPSPSPITPEDPQPGGAPPIPIGPHD